MAVPVKPLDQAIYVFALHSIPEQIVKHVNKQVTKNFNLRNNISFNIQRH